MMQNKMASTSQKPIKKSRKGVPTQKYYPKKKKTLLTSPRKKKTAAV